MGNRCEYCNDPTDLGEWYCCESCKDSHFQELQERSDKVEYLESVMQGVIVMHKIYSPEDFYKNMISYLEVFHHEYNMHSVEVQG